ncbi:Ppx/GppA family phosphatase [Salsuginibacillus kocurii]|uniref:Ppx/GppA family phosphatase n=1 Tax=Salsuginibacillus kocurii TaxID=427078 RepID=UPI000375A52D|nr:Ppx/GppA family phosphatase [Salsuginibacillus kocurii]
MNRHSKEKVAVIDMGSNSIRLVIHQVDEKRGYRQIHNVKDVARLSNFIDQDRKLTEEGFRALEQTIVRFNEIIEDHQVTNIRGIATAAVRHASNQQQILSFIKEKSGMDFEVLSGHQEAYYGYVAVINSTPLTDGITVDIGGGSTEVTLFKNRKLLHTYSFDFGALTLERLFFQGAEPNDKRLAELSSFVQNQFAKLPWLKNAQVPIAGIGGSARNMALIHQRQQGYPLSNLHQYPMEAESVNQTLKYLAALPYVKRLEVDGLSKDRADIIVPAVALLNELVQYTAAPQFVLSNKGLRDGLLFDTLLKPLEMDCFPSVSEESFYQLEREYDLPAGLTNSVLITSLMLYDELAEHAGNNPLPANNREILRMSAKVVYLGEYIDESSSSDHTFYLLLHRSIDGVSHRERAAMALIASFKSRKLFKKRAQEFNGFFTSQELNQYEQLGAILKLSYSLHLTRRSIISNVNIINKQGALHFQIEYDPDRDPHFEIQACDKHKKHLEKALGTACMFEFIKG